MLFYDYVIGIMEFPNSWKIMQVRKVIVSVNHLNIPLRKLFPQWILKYLNFLCITIYPLYSLQRLSELFFYYIVHCIEIRLIILPPLATPLFILFPLYAVLCFYYQGKSICLHDPLHFVFNPFYWYIEWFMNKILVKDIICLHG